MADLIDRQTYRAKLLEAMSDGYLDEDTVYTMIIMLDGEPTVAVPQWISVKERMPEKKDSYLVVKDLFGDKIETICGFTKNLRDVSFVDFDGNTNPGWYDYDSEYGYFEVNNVTHWMPLPEAPKEEEQ